MNEHSCLKKKKKKNKMGDVAFEHKVITARICKQIYTIVTLINMLDRQKWKYHMSIIKTS